jgi:hypothetical protein
MIQDFDNFTNESIRSLFASSAQYKPSDPRHKLLYNSFINWFKGMREKYDEDLIMNMLMSAEEDIKYGEI